MAAPLFVTVRGGTANFNAVQGNFNQHNYNASDASHDQVMKTLREHIASGALHDSAERSDRGDPPKCHKDTRIAVLEMLMNWLQDPADSRLFLWLFGPAGAGKTAISGTIAEMAEELNLLTATFFFNRSTAKRNIKDFFVTTLAYQIARSWPAMRPFLKIALDNDPDIFSRQLPSQLQTLIIKPLNAAVKHADTIPTTPHLIIVDGLDECDNSSDTHRYLLKILFQCAKTSNYPIRILVASRPEWQIRKFFSGRDLHLITKLYDLEEDTRAADDIRTVVLCLDAG